MHFETVIGLEVHVELKTDSKIFSPSPAHFGAEPNTNTNVIDLGYPGVLPVVNKRAVEWGMKAAMALNMTVARELKFDRKNYFYPDNPKAYQISQFDQPIGENGWIDIEVNGETKRIGITRAHLEEDAGKLTHKNGYSLVDLNRQGTPLIEIVSEPDIRTPEEAYAYLEKLRSIIQYIEVSDVKMEEGSMRCDANISIRPYGQDEFGTKTELKNLNSFTFVKKGLEYEEKRQEQVILSGGVINQETRRFDETTGTTKLMRVKEGSDDYRYFPEPDLVPIVITDEKIEEVRRALPELQDAKIERFVSEYGLSREDATILTVSRKTADFLDATVKAGADAKTVANWMLGDLSKMINESGLTFAESKVSPENLAGMIALIDKGTISGKIAKKVIVSMWESGKDADTIVKEEGLVQITDTGAIEEIVKQVIANNPQPVADFKSGNGKAIGFLVGQVMKLSKGKANPEIVNELIMSKLN